MVTQHAAQASNGVRPILASADPPSRRMNLILRLQLNLAVLTRSLFARRKSL